MSATVGLTVENSSSQKKIHKTAKEAKVGGEAIYPNAQTQEALTSTVNKFEAISIATQTQANHTCCEEDDSHLYGRESFSPVPLAPLPAPLSSTSLPSLHGNYGHTNSKFYRSGLNSDSVCQESCSRREFNDSSLSTVAVENKSHSSVSASAVSSSSTLSSSSSLPLSSSSPSICCYTIASHSKAISKQSARANSYGLANSSSHKQKFSRSLLEENFNPLHPGYGGPSVVVGKYRSSAIPKSIKTKVSPPPVPPKPSKNKRNTNSKSKSHVVSQLSKNQEINPSDKSYYDPASFRRKLQKFEKQNTLIGKSKNNVTRASDKDEDDQGDERCEFLGCFSAGNNTNSDQSVSDNSCVGSIKSVSGGEQDYDIVYTAITRSNNSTNNINNNNNSYAIDREHPSLSNGREWRVNDERKDSIRSGKRTLRYDSFGRLKSVEHSVAYGHRSVSDIPLTQIGFEQPSAGANVVTAAAALSSAVVIRKLTPKLSKQLNFRNEGIPSRRCASDDSLISSCRPYAEHQSPYSHHIEQRKHPAVTHSSSNVLSSQYGYQKGSTSSFSDSVSASAPSVTQIDVDISRSRDHYQHHQQHHHNHQANNGKSKKIFKSLSDTNNANLSKSITPGQLIGVRGNLGSYFHSASTTDVQDCILSDIDINSSLNYIGEKNSVICECGNRRQEVDDTQCHTVNNECIVESCLYYKVAHYHNPSSTDSQYQTLIEDNSNSSDLSNLAPHIDTTDSLSANSSSSSLSCNFSSPTVRGPLVLKRIPAIESFGYIPQSHASGAVCKEIMMEKRRNTLDRWQRLGFGRRSSPTPANQERARKSSDKSERLKELTELLRRNRSSPTPPPIPPPRKSRHAVSASSSIEKTDDTPLHYLSTQSEDILLMDQDEENDVVTNSNMPSTSQHEHKIAGSSNDLNKPDSKRLCESLKPNTSLSNFETLLSSREMSKSPPPALQVDTEISTKLSRPESRTVIGSYARKGIPFRSASFSQIDYSSGKYIGATLSALRDRLRRDKTADVVVNADQSMPPKQDETKSDESGRGEKTEEDFIYIPLKKAEFNINLNCGDDDHDRCTPEVIPEEDSIPLEHEQENPVNANESEEKADLNAIANPQCIVEEQTVPEIIDEQSIPIDVTANPIVEQKELETVDEQSIEVELSEKVLEKEPTAIDEGSIEASTNPALDQNVPSTVDEQSIEASPNNLEEQPPLKPSYANELSEVFESNLATLVEEEIPLESPPDNFLQTATTCLIPVPVYECAAQEWNLNPPHEWVDVAPDEFGIYPEPVNTIVPLASEKRENEPSIRETLPIISVSQHPSTQLEEIEEKEFEGDVFPEEISRHSGNHPHQESSFDYTEVKKRYSHDDMEIGSEKRSSLDCSLQRLCSNADERKRIDKSRRRKGMYIESTDWVESPEVRNSRGLDLEVSLANFSVIKGDQSDECSSIMYLNSPGTDENQTPGSTYSLDLNTPESECNKPPVWTKVRRRTSLSCQSSEDKDDGISMPLLPHNNQSFLCTESVSDNESDRTPAPCRDRSSPSPALSDQDFKRYSKRPLRGPYGQMLEAEMKKPNRLHFEEILEELKDPDSLSVRRTRGGHHDTRSFEDHPRNLPQYSNSFRVRKSNTYLPIPTHIRAASTPSQIENVARSSGLSKVNSSEKRYQSTLDNSTNSDKKSYSDVKRAVSEATSSRPIHKKSSSLVPLDKQTKRSMDEIRMSQSSRSPSERSVLTESSVKGAHGKDLMPTPELLAELLQGASEKLVSEQRQQMFADTRTHVVQEIFRNEQSYVESLQTVVLKYFKVLKTPEHAGMIDSRTVDEIFFMVPDILAIHEKFLSELKARLDTWEPQQKVGDAFIETFSKTEVLEVYTSFVNNCNRAKNAIRTTKQSRPSFARFLETTAREHKGKLTLDNLLIKPVQKFPNYEMLFTRLIKHTDGDHPDQKHLQEVLKLVHDILVHINCKEREILENGQREATLRELEGIIEGVTELIAPDRQFLFFDLVTMPSGQGARKERGFFLFNDLLVITSIKRRSGTIRKPNTTSCPGSVASTLDTNKYKFMTKVSLDNLDIVKSKDESLRKIMNEIEQLADDCNKLQQIAEVTATIKYPHQILEDVIRDLHRDVQRQLSERQSNDAQLNMLEITVNSPNVSQRLAIIFSKAEKRSQWEEAFNEAKQKLAATLERHPIPEFMTSIPIVKTRAGLQFTCAAPTLSEQKDVWVCNSDGYVGQVCVMSLSPEPNVTSCNGVCNARILCLASVPACSESEHKPQRSSLNEETTVREFRKSSSPNFHTSQSEKKKTNPSAASSDIQLDSNSSSDDSEPESTLHKDRIPSPSPVYAAGSATTHHHQNQDSNPDESDGNQSTMWLGTEDGYIHVYNCTDTIRIKKNKIKIQHASAVYSILYLDNRVFVSLANGDICVYLRDSVGWNTSSPLCISIGTVSSPVNKLLNVHGRLWCSIQGIIKVLDTKTLQVVNQIQISSDSKPITNMAVSSSYVWISIQNSAHIKCFHSNTHQLVTEVNLAPAVNKMLSNCDDIIRQHKAACLRVTSLLSCKDLIWIGTSAGVLLTIPAQGFEKGSPNVVPTGIPHGHTGHVRFLTFVETAPTKNSSSKLSDEGANTDYKNRRSSKHSKTKSETGNILIISGGDGYEDFRNSGANSLSEIAGREDSTNHLLIWQI